MRASVSQVYAERGFVIPVSEYNKKTTIRTPFAQGGCNFSGNVRFGTATRAPRSTNFVPQLERPLLFTQPAKMPQVPILR